MVLAAAAARKESLPGSEFPEDFKSNDFGRPAQQDSACSAKILSPTAKGRGT
jgi:hypothetical protein